MSKRKGMPMEEKRWRLLRLFHKKREFLTLKELEKFAPKEEGIVAQTVKDVLQSLVDDGMVQTDKVGTSVFFWSFPGENIESAKQRISEAEKRIREAKTKLEQLKIEIEKEKVGKESTEEHQKVLLQLEKSKLKESELQQQIEKFRDFDPEVMADMNSKANLYKDAANTWIDNIFAVQSWCNAKFNIEKKDINKHFNIPDDLDYIE